VLLTDKNLPDRSGLELIREARARVPDLMAIVITGYPSLETAIDAVELSLFDYIVKPPRDVFEVRRRVRQAFEKQALARENDRLLAELRAKNHELELALEALRATQSELVQAEKLAGIGTLAAGIAHEISSPLFGVMGLAEAIQEEDDTQLVRRYAADIVEYSRSIKEIVVELTGYSRSAANEYLTTVDLARVVEDAVRLVTRATPTERVEVVVACTPGLYVQARTNEVQQVFVNLVKNAIEAIREHPGRTGKVQVRTGEGPGHVWATVSDDGPGIPAERQPLVFDPFYTTKAPGKGTGLGLNIVYRIMTRYRGTISLESSAERGTTFSLKLPVG
jgi:C4-dicarboxylate-specific signal transduction histidine kinase